MRQCALCRESLAAPTPSHHFQPAAGRQTALRTSCAAFPHVFASAVPSLRATDQSGCPCHRASCAHSAASSPHPSAATCDAHVQQLDPTTHTRELPAPKHPRQNLPMAASPRGAHALNTQGIIETLSNRARNQASKEAVLIPLEHLGAHLPTEPTAKLQAYAKVLHKLHHYIFLLTH